MNRDVVQYFIANALYGTIGLFLHYVNATSQFVVLCRGIFGCLFIFLIMLIKKELPDFKAIKENLPTLIMSGCALGFNWVFLFAGYTYGVAITSLCNYTAPIIITILSIFIYKEKMSFKQMCFIFMAFVGIALVSGVFEGTMTSDYHCIVYGMLAALGFTALVFSNRRLKNIKPLDKTIVQLLISALVVFPYVCLTKGFPSSLDTRSLIFIIILGFVQTGLAYIFYFDAVGKLPINEVVVIGYIEPVLSILLGVLFLKEPIGILGIIGSVLIISAALLSELNKK